MSVCVRSFRSLAFNSEWTATNQMTVLLRVARSPVRLCACEDDGRVHMAIWQYGPVHDAGRMTKTRAACLSAHCTETRHCNNIHIAIAKYERNDTLVVMPHKYALANVEHKSATYYVCQPRAPMSIVNQCVKRKQSKTTQPTTTTSTKKRWKLIENASVTINTRANTYCSMGCPHRKRTTGNHLAPSVWYRCREHQNARPLWAVITLSYEGYAMLSFASTQMCTECNNKTAILLLLLLYKYYESTYICIYCPNDLCTPRCCFGAQ